MRFLDRFVYKNPKQRESDHGGSLMQVGLDLCTVGTPLLWTPWEPSEVSCTERYPHCRAKFTQIGT